VQLGHFTHKPSGTFLLLRFERLIRGGSNFSNQLIDGS
jgi:hypothetical protein